MLTVHLITIVLARTVSWIWTEGGLLLVKLIWLWIKWLTLRHWLELSYGLSILVRELLETVATCETLASKSRSLLIVSREFRRRWSVERSGQLTSETCGRQLPGLGLSVSGESVLMGILGTWWRQRDCQW